MTKEDYRIISRQLRLFRPRDQRGYEVWLSVVDGLSAKFYAEFKDFNPTTFRRECGTRDTQ